MIKLNRVPLSANLQAEIDKRIDILLDHLARDEKPPQSVLDFYKTPKLKAHVTSECNEKCMYCESKVTHVYYGDVEHIRPKALFPTERLDPPNLGYVCAICNGAKSDFWNDEVPLLNPFDDDPADHLLVWGNHVARRPGSARGQLTAAKLELNRPALLERRKERIGHLEDLAHVYAMTAEGPVKDLIRAELRRHAKEDSEYSFFVREYLKRTCDLDP